MRRIFKSKEVDKSKEKEKKDRLVHAIAIEQTVNTSLVEQNKELASAVASIAKEREEVLADIDSIKEKKRKHADDEAVAKARAIRAQAEADEKERLARELAKNVDDLRDSIRSMRDAITSEQEVISDVRRRESEEYTKHISHLRSQVADLEARVTVLSKSERDISDSISNKKLEIQGVEKSLEFRLQELARVNMTVDNTLTEYEKAREEYELFGHKLEGIRAEFARVDKEVSEKVDEVRKKEAEVLAMREQLVALVMREKKLDEKSNFIKDLFAKAGIDVKL